MFNSWRLLYTAILIAFTSNWLLPLPTVKAQEAIPQIQWYGSREPIQPLMVDGQPLRVLSIFENASLSGSPSVQGPLLPGKPFFLEVFDAYRAGPGLEFYLVHNHRLGWRWIKAQNILISQVSISEGERDQLETQDCTGGMPRNLAQNTGANPTNMKVVPKNIWQTNMESISLYSGPGTNYRIIDNLSSYRIQYIFRIM